MTTPAPDNFFSDLENTKPFVKLAFEGFPGSGKTFTMAQIAAGLHAHIGSSKPIAVFDTERAAKFLRRFFQKQGIQVLHKESRSMADLKETMKRCRAGAADILMIDSISHLWENFLEAYMKKKNRSRLQFEDWGIIKPAWRAEFSDPFVNDPYHTLMAGRAAFEYEDEKDEEGKRQIHKSGIKMRAEGETAYEPDILVLMSRCEDVVGKDKVVWREATIIKDRADVIDGKTFRDPGFEVFLPSIEYVLDAPTDRRPGPEGDASALFKTEEDKREYLKRRDIALENIEAYMISVGFAGQSADAKKKKVEALNFAFGTASWTAISGMNPAVLEDGLARLRQFVASAIQEAAQAMS